MNLPKIPPWCIPWQARRLLAQAESQRAALVAELAAERESHRETTHKKIGVEMAVEENKANVERLQRAVGGLTRWIFVTHKIDDRATTHGLTDILKEFPR